MSQSKAEQHALIAAWDALPEVREWMKARNTFIASNPDLGHNVESWNRMVAFDHEWFAKHGHLPKSGLMTG